MSDSDLHSRRYSYYNIDFNLEQAFGSHSEALGIIIVRDLPTIYQTHRETLLKYAYKFAHLPEETKERYVDPGSSYRYVMTAHMSGWS